MIGVTILALIGTWLIAEYIGKYRKIGYRGSLIWSLMFTPIVGLLVSLISPKVSA